MITVDDNKSFVTSRGCERRERPARVFYANVLASRWTSLTRCQEAARITVCEEKLNANSGALWNGITRERVTLKVRSRERLKLGERTRCEIGGDWEKRHRRTRCEIGQLTRKLARLPDDSINSVITWRHSTPAAAPQLRA